MKRILKALPVIFVVLLTMVAILPPAINAATSCSIAIPDGGSNLTNVITIYTSIVITDVDVVLDISHTYVNDLTASLTSPASTTISLFDGPGGSGDNIITTLDDESPNGSVQAANPPTGPSYTPNQPLSSFDTQNAQGNWTFTISDTVAEDSGNLNAWSLVINGTSYTCTDAPVDPPTDPEEPVVVSVPNTDYDGDGISNSDDNCSNVSNSSQEDGWGTGMGDACDIDWYNRVGVEVAGFVQKDGMFNVYGNCVYMADGAPRCPEIAILNPLTFSPDQTPIEVTNDLAGNWSVWLYYLHSNDGDVYQVNIYSTNPPQPDTLVDDHMQIHVHGSSWKWYQRGGAAEYGGIPEGIYTGSGSSSETKGG